ncbi:chorismate mutase [Streptomyces sp. NPDC092296]|uniref:chorismate mutase n=1 Tax=Streptomyces sp. NPDC092296 TaxID=3366012 RepID=UPI003814B4F6
MTATPTPTQPGTAPEAEAQTETQTDTAAEAAAVIASARARIDDLDGRIIALVKQRAAASAEVQAARRSVGGPRLALSRELQILERFRTELGRPGTEVAKLLLELCRGPM